MKKENLIAQLEGVKTMSSQVDIDKVIELVNQLEPEVKNEILKVPELISFWNQMGDAHWSSRSFKGFETINNLKKEVI